MINDCFRKIEDLIQNNRLILNSKISINKINDYSGVIKGILYYSGTRLEFIEVIDLDNNPGCFKKKYKYHFMDHENNLIFRYDNVRHYPDIETFPHHKHIASGVFAFQEPSLKFVLREIKEFQTSRSDTA